MPHAFGLYMARGYCARRDLRGITADARRVAVMSLRMSSLWYVCGRACRPRERMYADSDGTGKRTPFIQTEGALHRIPNNTTQHSTAQHSTAQHIPHEHTTIPDNPKSAPVPQKQRQPCSVRSPQDIHCCRKWNANTFSPPASHGPKVTPLMREKKCVLHSGRIMSVHRLVEQSKPCCPLKR